MSGLQSSGYAALPDLLAAMRAGPTQAPFVMQADLRNMDTATAQTIEQMALLIKESIDDPLTQSIAERACSTWGQGSKDPRSVAWACWWYAKHSIRFVLDQPAARKFTGMPEALEFLVSPALMLRSRKMQGDCDDFTMMICALLGSRGLGYEIITVAANPREPRTFSHVYCRAILPDGSRFPLDASREGKYPGWQVPAAHVSRLQAWNEDGNPVEDAGSNNWDGLHGYSWNRGLGQTEDAPAESDTPDDLTSFLYTIDPNAGANATTGFLEPLNTGDIASSGGFGPIGSPVGCASGYVVADASGDCALATSTQGQSATASFSANPAAQIASSLETLFAPNSPLAKAILPNQGTVSISSSSLLLYGGLAVGAILLLALIGKK